MMKKLLLLVFISSLCLCATAQQPDTVFLKTLLQSRPDLFGNILKQATQNEVQILYTQIDRDSHNNPHFTSFSYHLNPRHYFYPASTVKLPTLIFAMEKVNELKIKGLTLQSAMLTDSCYAGQTWVTRDTSSTNGLPSLENYIKKILLVSDNDAYNRLYEFVGREEINLKLKKYGLIQTRIVSRLAVGDGGGSARHTNQIRFYNGDKLVYTKPALTDSHDYPMYATENLQQGKGYIDKNDQLVMAPFDFSDKNNYPLADQQTVLKHLLFPEVFPKEQRFNLTNAQ
ncbi:beta-lactamase family protein [Mucilaginibacter yixingensis]|uniref:beta-lactamase n=1 Tax=Mucilaginibacter yixingensis TaxID=1295612 RepID=A0A2T5J548_9SPHI|nr:serine hydrolase [Mucilaginibacter yixingensis]PTQ92951.1 beta-lactamase family protein [Mucilaginibacter yixingensis]